MRSLSQNVLKLILKSPIFFPLGANLTHFGCQIVHPWCTVLCSCFGFVITYLSRVWIDLQLAHRLIDRIRGCCDNVFIGYSITEFLLLLLQFYFKCLTSIRLTNALFYYLKCYFISKHNYILLIDMWYVYLHIGLMFIFPYFH